MRSIPCGRQLPLCAAVALTLVMGAALPWPVLAQSTARPAKADELLLVDCLLPGQIRRLGRQAMILTARRAVKTSARDCEIRGGEYVAWDRASYATALKVWLPLANEGDPVAQTYVGEIYEKGLGLPPNYAEAERWYRRAAESGHPRAAVNLGYLYEQGLGVPKDPAQAASWYRRALGSQEAVFQVEPAAAPAEAIRPTPMVAAPPAAVPPPTATPIRAPAPATTAVPAPAPAPPATATPVPAPAPTPAAAAAAVPGPAPAAAASIPPSPPALRASLALGKYHALVIGNDDYRALPRLTGAAEGARDVARILRDEYGFQVVVTTNASRYDMLAALNDLRQRLDDKDNLLIYYAGHGQADPDGREGYWLPVDGEPGQPATWMANSAITEFLSAMKVRQVLVATDACYSGILSRSAVASSDARKEQARLTFIETVAKRRSRVLMTAGRCDASPAAGSRLSSFTRSFIEVLQGNRDVLAGQELFALLRSRMAATDRPEAGATLLYAPIQYAGHEAGDFVFVRATRN